MSQLELECTLEQESNCKVPINMMVIAPNTQCSDDGGGGGDEHRTVKCLRGRLLSERVASKAAKQEAQQMAKRMEEIEKRLDEEMKSRDRAERKLKHALKKLESLKILDAGSSWDLSFSSSSSATDSEQCGSIEAGKGEVLGLLHSEEEVEGSLCSSVTLQSLNPEEPDKMKTDHVDDVRLETMELQSEHDEEDNKMAIVPANVKLDTETCTPKKMNQNVQGVLLALRQVREQLQYYVARRSDFCSQNELYGQQGRFSSRVL